MPNFLPAPCTALESVSSIGSLQIALMTFLLLFFACFIALCNGRHEAVKPSVTIKPSNFVAHLEGATVRLRCKADDQLTSVAWYFQGQRVIDVNRRPHLRERRRGDGTIALVVKEARKSDSGKYQCRGESKLGTVKKTVKVTIRRRKERPSYFTNWKSAIEVKENASVKIVCWKRSPLHIVRLSWHRGKEGEQLPAFYWAAIDDTVQLPRVYSIDRGLSVTMMVFENVKKEDGGVYRCEADDSLSGDINWASVRLRVRSNNIE